MPFRHSCSASTIAEINFGFLFQGDAYYIIQVEDSAKNYFVFLKMGEKPPKMTLGKSFSDEDGRSFKKKK